MLYFLSECVKQFQSQRELEIRRGKETVKTTVDQECLRHLEIYVANAKTRLKLRAKRQEDN